MADLDDFIVAVTKAAKAASLECKGERVTIQFVVSEPDAEKKVFEKPSESVFQHVLSVSFAHIKKLPAKQQVKEINEMLKPIKQALTRHDTLKAL
jgi:hypothetical protein